MYFVNEDDCTKAVKDALKSHRDAIYEIAEAAIRLCNEDTDLDFVADGIVEDICEMVWYNSEEEPDPDVADMRARAEYENVYVDMAKERGLF